MENGHLLQRKIESRRRKRGACQTKINESVKMKGALVRVEKGKGHFYKIIRALVKVKWGLFLRIKGHFFLGGGGVGTVPLAKRKAKPVDHSLIIFILV